MTIGNIYAPTRRQILIGGAALAGAGALPQWAEAQSPGVLRIGMTAADIPQMTGSPDNGFEGYRFCGYTLYDALINWDLSSADKPSDLIPGLAESWEVDPSDKTKWLVQAADATSISMTVRPSMPTRSSGITKSC